MIEINKSRSFTNSYDHDSFSVVRVYNRHLKALGGRNAWVKLESDSAVIYRMVKAGKSSSGFNSAAIETDYDSLLELGQIDASNVSDENKFYPCKLTISPSRIIWDRHLNKNFRSANLSILSLIF
jgi:hypothetical protein